jgi:predicted nucleotidyltransferase
MELEDIISIVQNHYPRVEGIYLFGTFGTAMERRDSDLDLALLFSPEEARSENSLAFSGCRDDLEAHTGRSVDIINLREANTVFQNEIIAEGRLIYRADEAKTDAFEMKVLSNYQKLNEERGGILKEIETTGRIIQ